MTVDWKSVDPCEILFEAWNSWNLGNHTRQQHSLITSDAKWKIWKIENPNLISFRNFRTP